MFNDFKLVHEEGRLFARVVIDEETHVKDVTEYFKKGNAHDDWLDYRLDQKYLSNIRTEIKKEEGINEN